MNQNVGLNYNNNTVTDISVYKLTLVVKFCLMEVNQCQDVFFSNVYTKASIKKRK